MVNFLLGVGAGYLVSGAAIIFITAKGRKLTYKLVNGPIACLTTFGVTLIWPYVMYYDAKEIYESFMLMTEGENYR